MNGGGLTAEEREALHTARATCSCGCDTSLHYEICSTDGCDCPLDEWEAEAEAIAVLLAARASDGLAERVQALADEACSAIASAPHSHWRAGGAGGTCQTCIAATERAKDLRARFRALLDEDPAR